jgi:hypothetical protein
VYGVPATLDLTFLHDAELIQVCLGVYELQLHFHPVGSISVMTGWELFDHDGVRIDHGGQAFPRPAFELHRLLGQKVMRTQVNAPSHIDLLFERGERLRVTDDSTQYEAFTIQPGDIVV